MHAADSRREGIKGLDHFLLSDPTTRIRGWQESRRLGFGGNTRFQASALVPPKPNDWRADSGRRSALGFGPSIVPYSPGSAGRNPTYELLVSCVVEGREVFDALLGRGQSGVQLANEHQGNVAC
jgi:hypothetical protein